jgi:hypothetical protein
LSQTAPTTPLGYPQLNLGLNNQKMALLGLFSKAETLQRPLILPNVSNFDAKFGRHSDVPLDHVYKADRLHLFASAFGLKIIAAPPVREEEGWHCFVAGAERMGRDAIRGPIALDDFTCQFFRHLTPRICETPLFKNLATTIFATNQVKLVGHLRIESDWISHAENIKSKDPAQNDAGLSAVDIIAKIQHTMRDECETIYVVCDEANLPVPKDEIRAEIFRRFGISLIWKSDILTPEELAPLSILDLSIIDFEMSVRAPLFAGVSHSSFSNLVNLESFCRTRHQPQGHYIYNLPGDLLARRWDYGTIVDTTRLTNKLFRREPLIPDSRTDCLWPATLTTHIAEYGDFTSETSSTPGIRRGHLVGGYRGSQIHTIEGFSIIAPETFDLPIEYRACLADGTWTPWLKPGAFAGTRGQKQSLRGFAARLTGRLALSFECLCIASFASHFELVVAHEPENCLSPDGAKLESMQIVFRERQPELLF